jgi:hypothetical protein
MIEFEKLKSSTRVVVPAKQQGKTEQTLRLVEWAIAAKRKFAIGTANPETLYHQLKARFPDADIRKDKQMVVINGKS